MDKKNKNPNVPNLRFLKFNQNYETLQLKNTLKIKSGKDQKQVEVENGIYNIYGTGGIIGHTNTFLYDKESVGIGRKGTIDKPVYFDQPFWTVDTLFYSEIYEGFIPKYIFYLFQTINWKKYNTSTGVPSLTSSSIENIEKSFPCYDEQLKVANFLTMIDMRIETQIKIINDYKILKNHIIKSFIKQNGTSYLLSEIAELGRGRVINSAEISKQKNPIYPVYSSQTSNNGIMGYLDNYDYEGEYITWTTDGANAGTVYYRNGKFNCTNVCGILKIKNGYDAYYISNILNCYTKKYVSTNLANPKLMNNVMANIKINLPSIEQQKHSSKILQSIEYRVEIEEDIKLNLVKQKAFLLKNMFI